MIRSLAFALLSFLPAASLADTWAVGGYDPVAYLSQDRAVAGRSDLATNWRGQQYHFATPENRAAFEANPRAYVPGLAGYCVVALAEGRLEPGDPRNFVIIGSRLYLVGSASRKAQLLENPRELLMHARDRFVQLSR